MAERDPSQLPPGTMYKNKYRVTKKLGEGGFGPVYLMENASNGEKYAMKVAGCRELIQDLNVEVAVLRLLKKRGAKHACDIIDLGRNDQIHYVLMTLVGKSLQDLRKEGQGQHLSLSSALRIGKQCLEAIADIHETGYLHHNIKPGNFAVGRPEVNQHRNVFLQVFASARKFRKSEKPKLRTMDGGRPFNARYGSLSLHHEEQGRKDELETWFYIQVELTVGKLPWDRSMWDFNEMTRLKKAHREDGTLFTDCPPEYPQMLRYIDGLKTLDKPDYDQLYKLISQACQADGFNDGDPYDWEKPAADAS